MGLIIASVQVVRNMGAMPPPPVRARPFRNPVDHARRLFAQHVAPWH